MDEQLTPFFQRINEQHFGGVLPLPELRWNSRLRASAGRFHGRKPIGVIEIATYLKTLENAEQYIWDTLAHEMIHHWLWCRRRPYGHNAEFLQKMREMGVSRYNSVPKNRAPKHAYSCSSCGTRVLRRRRLTSPVACGQCCRRYSQGRFDHRFLLVRGDP